MKKMFTDEQMNEQIDKKSEEAEELLNDEDQLERFLERLEHKLKKVPMVGKKLSNVPVLVSLVRSYAHKEYRDIPIGSVIAIVGALIYFVSPIDLIPDSIPVLGYVDDAAVFGFVWNMVEDDVEEYKSWQEKNDKRIILD
ncbi:MAG: YkvA family protein [Bacillota bacterium]|nr:YkvA family protein [Bacillota bacterium]